MYYCAADILISLGYNSSSSAYYTNKLCEDGDVVLLKFQGLTLRMLTVDESKMVDMNRFLDDYLESMPKTLVDRMTEIEHKVDGKIIRKSKLTLLSYANIAKNAADYELDGTDDIPFDGLLTKAERVKNLGYGIWQYWLDTLHPIYEENSMIVDTVGDVGHCYSTYNEGVVVPCFALKRKE